MSTDNQRLIAELRKLSDTWGDVFERSADQLEQLERQLERELAAERALADRLAHGLEDIAFGTVINRSAGGCGQTQLWTAPQMAQHADQALAAWKGQRKNQTETDDDQACDPA